MRKVQVREALRREQAVLKRLYERVELAQDNIVLSKKRIRELEEKLKVAPDSPGFFY